MDLFEYQRSLTRNKVISGLIYHREDKTFERTVVPSNVIPPEEPGNIPEPIIPDVSEVLPSLSVVMETTFGQESTSGVDASFSRGDHTHGTPEIHVDGITITGNGNEDHPLIAIVQKGDKGDTGPQGPQGVRGLTGEMGLTGAQGLTGDKGDKGDKGDTGIQGLTGPQGVQGLQGDIGLTGPQGPQGEQGVRGFTGLQGETGLTGPQGPQGIQGVKGDKGDVAYSFFPGGW